MADDSEPTTITVPVTIEIAADDDVHRGAWQQLKATAPDEDTVCRQLGDLLGESVDGKGALYQLYREVEAQRGQVRQSLDVQLETQPGSEEAQADDG